MKRPFYGGFQQGVYMRLYLALLVMLFAPAIGYSQVVEDNVTWITWTDSKGVTYEARIIQSIPDNDYTGTWFTYKNALSSLQVTNWNLDEESSWYLVQQGQEFSPATIAANQFPVLFTPDNQRPPVTIPAGEFYLGATTEVWLKPGYQAYGWLKVGRNGETLSLLDSAFSYSVPGAPAGIYVGTGTAVPEPSELVALISGLAMFGCRGRRSR